MTKIKPFDKSLYKYPDINGYRVHSIQVIQEWYADEDEGNALDFLFWYSKADKEHYARDKGYILEARIYPCANSWDEENGEEPYFCVDVYEASHFETAGDETVGKRLNMDRYSAEYQNLLEEGLFKTSNDKELSNNVAQYLKACLGGEDTFLGYIYFLDTYMTMFSIDKFRLTPKVLWALSYILECLKEDPEREDELILEFIKLLTEAPVDTYGRV